MDTFLEHLRDNGSPDSQGEFTLSPEKAHWKLSEYRLANRHEYPAHLLACAVAGGASYFHLKIGLNTTVITFDGAPFTVHQLNSLGSHRSGRLLDRRLAELEVALSAASAHGVVRFDCHQGEVCRQIQLLSGEAVLTETPYTGESGHTFLVETRLDTKYVTLFQELCRFAPLSLTIDDRRCDQPLDFGAANNLVRGVWYCQGTERLAVKELAAQPQTFVRVKKHSGEGSLLLCLLEPRWAGYPETLLLSDGVVVATERDFFDFPMLVAAVTVSHLKKDLTAQGLVKDRTFEELRVFLEKEIDHFLAAFCHQPPDTRGVFQRCFRQSLVNRYEAREAPDSVKLYLTRTKSLGPTVEPDRLLALTGPKTSPVQNRASLQMSKALLLEAQRAWLKEDWDKVAEWNEANNFLRKRAAPVTPNFDEVPSFLAYARRFEVDPEKARSVMLNTLADRGTRFRTLLTLWPESKQEDWSKTLDLLGLSDPWRAPLGLFSDRPLDAPVWELARCILTESGPYQALAAFESCTEFSALERAIWLDLIAKTLARNATWTDQVRLTALRSTSWVGLSPALRREFLHLLEYKEKARRPPTIDSRFFRLPERDEFRLPVALYQGWLVRPLEEPWSQRILARYLLIQSFRMMSGSVDLELPPDPLRF